MILHDGVSADLDGENGGETPQPVDKPCLAVGEVAACKWVESIQEGAVLKLVQAKLDAGENPIAILASCREGMVLVGKRFEAG